MRNPLGDGLRRNHVTGAAPVSDVRHRLAKLALVTRTPAGWDPPGRGWPEVGDSGGKTPSDANAGLKTGVPLPRRLEANVSLYPFKQIFGLDSQAPTTSGRYFAAHMTLPM